MDSTQPPDLPPENRIPPVVARPALPRPKRPRNPWKVATLLLVAVLVLGLAGYLIESVARVFLSGPGTRTHGPRLEEVTLEHNHSANKIAVISVEGIIMSVGGGPRDLVEVVEEQLKSAKQDDDVKAVVLKVDSPGGQVLASDNIARAIAKFQKESRKPVVASMASLAASGGYYVSVPCQWIVANELTLTGSIGVIMQSFNYRGLMDKVGLRPETFKSGKYKDMLSGSKKEGDITQEERDMVQKLVNETFEKFKSVVAEGRKQANEKNKPADEPGRTLDATWTNYADGRVLSGKQAHELGFVDELGTFDTAVARARKLAGIKDANLVEYQPVLDFSSLFRLFSKTEVGRVKVDVGLDVPRLKAGYLYFLSPTYVH